jgi:hypothetical protein
VLTLVDLGRQIESQNGESRIAAMHEISVAFREATSRLLDSGIAEIFVKALYGLIASRKKNV